MQVQCSKCSEPIALADIVELFDGRLAHVDCRRVRTLTAAERALVVLYCPGHIVAECLSCNRRYRFAELGSDMLGGGSNFCPRCRKDLTENVRGHLYGCAMLPSEVRLRAQAVRGATQHLVKQSRQARDRTDVLLREAEA